MADSQKYTPRGMLSRMMSTIGIAACAARHAPDGLALGVREPAECIDDAVSVDADVTARAADGRFLVGESTPARRSGRTSPRPCG